MDKEGPGRPLDRQPDRQRDHLQGTLDMLILKAVSLGPLHGYGVLLRIQQISGEELVIQQGSLYPALYRLEHQGANGARARTTARPNIIGLRRPVGSGWKRKGISGTGCRT
jgi:Transcriptional regulator PadR-like family